MIHPFSFWLQLSCSYSPGLTVFFTSPSKGLIQARLMHFTLPHIGTDPPSLVFKGEPLGSIAEEELLPNLLKCRSIIHGRKDSFPSVCE